MNKLKVLDLFSGIGGFSLGLERTNGFETVAFCEIDEKCNKVLKKNFPNIPQFNDIRTLNYDGSIDVVTGGFPCQDLSTAGKKAGIEEGERSGLWSEMLRIISHTRPKYAIMENVTGLLIGERGAWMGKLLSDLASIGYNAQWHCISVADCGGGHERKRIWVIAYLHKDGWYDHEKIFNSIALQISKRRPSRSALAILARCKRVLLQEIFTDHRKLDGLSDGVDRLEQIGNTICPDIAEIIGNAILENEASYV